VRRVALLIGVIVLGVASFSVAQVPRDQTVVVAANMDSGSMNPWLSTTITDKNVVTHIYDTLLMRDENMQVQPHVARSFRPIDDTTWEFELRDDVVFTNGERLTAHSVAFTLDHFRDPSLNAPSIAQFGPIERIDVIDDYRLQIVTSQPFPALPTILTEFWIIPEGHTSAVGGQGLSNDPVGSGPYVLLDWVRDERIVLEANPNHWNGVPDVQYVEFRVVPDQNTRIAQAQTGEADIVAQVPVEALPLLERSGRVRIVEAAGPRAYFVVLSTRHDTPLRDVRVRQALNYAVNVDEILATIFDGRGNPLSTILTPEQFGYDSSIDPYGYDPERARQLLSEAGFPDGFSIAMEGPTSRYPKDVEVSQAIAAQFAAVGVQVDLKIVEWGTYIGQFRAELGPPIWLLGWSIPTFDPDAILTPLLTPGHTYDRYDNPELAALIDRARSTVDAGQRREVYSEVQRVMHEQAPMVFLYQLDELFAVSNRIDWQPRSDERIYLWTASWAR
jgi:peptide/nickel transport system substrate-binding protein